MPTERLWTREFGLCFLANLAQGIAFNLFLHFPGFMNEIGASDVQIGLLFGLTGASAIVARPPIGRFMDARGRIPVIHVGNALNVLAVGAYLAVDSMGPLIYGVRVVHGLAEAMLFTAFFTYAADCVPAARRTQGLALFGVSGMLPIAIGGLLGDAILPRAGFSGLFLASTGLALLAALASLPLRDLPRGGSADEAKPHGFRAALGQRDLLPLWWITMIFSVALASVFIFLKRFIDETGLSTVGSFFSAYSGAAIVLRVFFGWLPDRIGAKRVLFPALAALAVAFGLLGSAAGAAQVVVAGVFFGIGHGFTFPILFGIVVTRARDADRGSVMGIYTALLDVGIVIGGPLFGAIVTASGFPALFAAAAAAVVGGTLVFLVWDRGR